MNAKITRSEWIRHRYYYFTCTSVSLENFHCQLERELLKADTDDKDYIIDSDRVYKSLPVKTKQKYTYFPAGTGKKKFPVLFSVTVTQSWIVFDTCRYKNNVLYAGNMLFSHVRDILNKMVRQYWWKIITFSIQLLGFTHKKKGKESIFPFHHPPPPPHPPRTSVTVSIRLLQLWGRFNRFDIRLHNDSYVMCFFPSPLCFSLIHIQSFSPLLWAWWWWGERKETSFRTVGLTWTSLIRHERVYPKLHNPGDKEGEEKTILLCNAQVKESGLHQGHPRGGLSPFNSVGRDI